MITLKLTLERMMNSLTLKFGTVKGWDLESQEAIDALNEWAKHGVSMSVMSQNDSAEQKEALIKAIDFMDEIWNDWEGTIMTKEEAKEYIRNYDK